MAYKILVVDDSKTARKFNKRCLEKVGFLGAEFLEAENGVEALEILKVQPVDLIITDLDMPEMDGRDLCQSLRENIPTLPVVVLSATADSEDRAKLKAGGATAVLQKPAFPPQFKYVLDAEILRFKQASSEQS